MAIIQGAIDRLTGLAPTLKIGGRNAAARVEARPWDLGTDENAFRIAAKSGAITGTGVVAGGPLFSVRWSGGNNTGGYFVLTKLRAVLDVTTIFTAAQEIGIDAVRATAFNAGDSAGTALTPTGPENKMRSAYAGSATAGIRIAAATVLTAGTRTLDTNPFAISNAVGERIVNVAAGTGYLPAPPQAVLDFTPGPYEYPLVLQPNEGFVIRNVVAFPAAGVVSLTVEMSWMELVSWP